MAKFIFWVLMALAAASVLLAVVDPQLYNEVLSYLAGNSKPHK